MNVPAGVAAVIAGRYLLPRTRQFSQPGRFDGPGTALLVAWTAALALAGAIAFVRRETRTVHPLIPVWLLRSASLIGGLVSMVRGIGATLGISLMALAWHLGSQSYQAGNTGYSGTEQARGQPIGPGEDPSGAFH